MKTTSGRSDQAPRIAHAEVEQFFEASGLKFRRQPQHEGVWELGFQGRLSRFTVLIDNGISNPNFLSINLSYLTAHSHLADLYSELLRKTGKLLFCKFTLDKRGNVGIRTLVLRDKDTFPLSKLKKCLAAILQGADAWYLELLNLVAGSGGDNLSMTSP